MANERLQAVLAQLKPATGGQSALDKITQKNPDDIVITLARRTPMARGFKGGFKDTDLDYLVLQLLQEVMAKSKLDPNLIDDVVMGNANNDKASTICRTAALAAGIPYTAGAAAISRFCSSGLMSIQSVAYEIAQGAIEIGIAIGAESMSKGPDRNPKPFHPEIMKEPDAADCMQPMGQTSENVGDDFGISREMQDRYSVESFRRAEVAQKAGWFEDEIVPIRTTVKLGKDGKGPAREVTVTKDEGPRYGTTLESLSKIRPAFPQFGNKTTGGNASQITDGAAAVILMKRSKAIELGQPILAKFVGATVAGVPPRIMGIGPSIAIPKLLSMYNLRKEDVDIFEINEAFASMAVYCIDKLGLDHEKVNPRGGAIALGHPLGCTGTRQVCTILSEARRTKKKVLVTSMCIGTGQGMAGLFINEQ
ncbi:3-ketoacyl-CoA thiolase [Histoplasma capsulatum]|uniref:3-ketoacyl-CoA thiolase n=1 Tax=Ajellomyces capsulatus TaxID=5037 RepID=A0A8A1LXM2_AJECA|nr:3-ketoacyl-CoA thiolase [Histoplasma mississippiense (nom. inval.)]EDN02916.1 3-ketoacyl-CoA thiolase [Histoplasma mississippiense (nom. inval.)]QSS58521.1 3-ketoacyl-CoA thiolase [Histoplasma capsulatum]